MPVNQIHPQRDLLITNKEAETLGVNPAFLAPAPFYFPRIDLLPALPNNTNISACVGLECLPFAQDRENLTSKTFFFVGKKLFDSGNVHLLKRFPTAGDRAWQQNSLGLWGEKGCIAWQLHPTVVPEMHIDSKSYVYVRIGEIIDGAIKIVTSMGETFLASGDYNPQFLNRLYTTNGCFCLDAPFDIRGTGKQVYRVFRLRRTGMSAFGALKRKVPFTLEKVTDPSTTRFVPQNLPEYTPSSFPSKKAWLASVFTILQDQAPPDPALRSALVYCRNEALAALVDDELPAEYDPIANFVTLVRMHEAVSGIMQTEGLAKLK